MHTVVKVGICSISLLLACSGRVETKSDVASAPRPAPRQTGRSATGPLMGRAAGSARSRHVVRIGRIRPPARFKQNYVIRRNGSQVARAFVGVTKKGRTIHVDLRYRTASPTGSIFRRDRVLFASDWSLDRAEMNWMHQVAPKIHLVETVVVDMAHILKDRDRAGTRTVTHEAFGYRWWRNVSLPDAPILVGRDWLIGASILARRYDLRKMGTQHFIGLHPKTWQAVPLLATGRTRGTLLTLTVQQGRRKVTLDYDVASGGIRSVQGWDGTVIVGGDRPVAVPVPVQPSKLVATKIFAWPAEFHQDELSVRTSDGVVLSGSLSWPKRKSRVLLVIVPEIGKLDRDGTMGLRKPYAELALALVQSGVTVLRYDRRGVGRSTGNYDAVTWKQETSDLEAWIRKIRRDKRLRRLKLVLVGHGFGGFVAGAAARKGHVAGLVLLGTPGRSVADAVVVRFRREFVHGGLPAATVASRVAYLKAVFAKIVAGTFVDKLWLAWPAYPVSWLKSMTAVHLDQVFDRVRCRVLVLRGASDLMATEQDTRALVAALRRNRHVQVPKALQFVGHYMQRSPYQLEIAPEEWFIPSGIDRGVVGLLTSWLTGVR